MKDTLEDFKRILNELKTITYGQELYKLDDSVLFDGAVRIYNSMILSRERSSREQLMTEKQRKLLQDLDYSGSMNLNKGEAATIIKERLRKS